MPRPGLVDQTELSRWADSRGAAGDFPRLVRRLILETGRGVVRLGFPAGEGIAAGGWDGTVRTTESTAHIPLGLSLWELSVEKSVNAKADKDYAKRLSTSDGSPTGECTYVAVSLRRWRNRLEWEREKASHGRWKGVHAYGIDNLETWLETAPVTHAWLSEVLGFHPHGLVTAETWWASWSGGTTPRFPADAVLAGRDAEAKAMLTRLARPGQIITVQGASRDDVLAFVGALGMGNAGMDGGALLARTAFIDEVAAWRRLRDHKTPLVLVPRAPDVIEDLGPGSAHHLIVPILGSGPADITLEPIDFQGARGALATAGLKEQQAEETGRLARLSLLAARRHIASKPELHRPPWAKSPAARLVRRALLAGRWNENSPADLIAISSLLGVDYDSLREELASLTSEGDPLLTRFGSSVGLVSPFDAWRLLDGELRKDDLELFQATALTVFGEDDPALQFPPDERWRGSLLGRVRSHSGDLRVGLATSLALLGWRGAAIVGATSLTCEEWATWTVRQVLEVANKDKSCRLWASLGDVLPLLAEAAPSGFLEAVTEGLSGVPPLLRGMFTDADSETALFSDSSHSSLLWALETCAWSPTYFGQAVDLLARLEEIDPGGRLANRPAASLESIFCPWYPQTSASTERRLAVLDGLRERHEPVAWKLMLSMLPERHGVAMPVGAPRFRDWKPEQISVTRREYWGFVEEVCRRMLEHVGVDPERWVSMIGEWSNLPPGLRASALAQLTTLSDDERLAGDARGQIWESLRSSAARHREFPTADWALPDEELAQIEEVAKRFEPLTPAERLSWLFDEHMPEIPDVHRPSDEYEEALAKQRLQAGAEIAASLAWPQLHAFGIGRKLPWVFGWALALAGRTEHEAGIIGLLKSEDSADLSIAAGYLSQRFRTQGWPWVEKCLREGALSPEQSGQLLLATADFPKAWEVAERAGEEVAAVFWHHFRTVGLGSDFLHVETVARRLLDAGRPGSALDLLALYLRNDRGTENAELMARGLEELLQHADRDPALRVLSQYRLMQIFSFLERSPLSRERLARLEWAYLPVFEYGSSPPTLSGYLAKDPSFFVDVVSKVYRPRAAEASEDDETASSEAATEPDEEEQALASNAYRLLSDWRALPGQRGDGGVDGEVLRAWVNEARRLLKERLRLGVGETHIGRVLAFSLAEAGDGWPCVEVRDLLEAIQSRQVEAGMRTGLFNSRGVTSRGPLDGGDQERALAAKYRQRADRLGDRWPRAATVLRGLADDYDREARRHDQDAERRRKGFDT